MLISKPIQVKVHQAEAVVTELVDKETITSGSLLEKHIVEEQVPAQIPSISIVESVEAMVVKPSDQTPQEREAARSEPVQSKEPSVIKVHPSTLGGEDVRADISLLEASPARSPMYLKLLGHASEDVRMKPQEEMVEVNLVVQSVDLMTGLGAL